MPPTSEDLRVSRIASLTLVNAMIFQQVLADRDARVQTLSRTISGTHVSQSFASTWKFILDDIDYVPIFSLAREIVLELTGSPGIDEALRQLATSAIRITGRRAALRHDLMGRIYHRLLADAKYFGAFYTTVPAATLIVKLTLDPSEISIDWSKLDQIREFKVGDLACGTGTLLKASLHTIVDNYVRACAQDHASPNLKSLHQILVENNLYGFDVIPFAIHLAAAAIATHEPDAQFGTMNLYTLPLGGGTPPKLGSLDLLTEQQIPVQADLFGSPTGPGRVTGAGDVSENVNAPSLDLCVMNPPFTRSVGGNLLFGNAPRRQRTRMQAELRRIVRAHQVQASITAGLGSVFVALGHKYLKRGGYLSLVLPRALLSGVAWKDTRRLIGSNYSLRYVIVSHEPNGWNFSENTELSECLFVARRLKEGEKATIPTKFVNLWRKPKSSIEALTVAELIKNTPGISLDAGSGTEELRTDLQKYGEVILCPPERAEQGEWAAEAAFAQTELCRVARYLVEGKIYIPGQGKIGKFPLTTLNKLGTVGPDRRDIHDGFRLATDSTPYAALWGHDTESVQKLSQDPNHHLSPLSRARRSRPLRNANLLWSRAGRLLIAERLWLDTIRVLSIRLEEPVLSNTWWPIAITGNEKITAEDIECILVLWLNSSLGIITLLAARVDTRGPWIEIKKPTLERLPILDPSKLSSKQRKLLIKAHDELLNCNLDQLPNIDRDEVRRQIDVAIAAALQIRDDLRPLRRILAIEPLVIGARH